MAQIKHNYCWRIFLGTLFSVLTLLSMGCSKKSSSDKLLIATAANMQFAMEALSTAFSEQSGIAVETIVSSSGKLYAQIKEGAPFDVFVSADLKYPNDLYKSGLTTAPPQVYAFGQLVIWTMKDQIPLWSDIDKTARIRHLALANPRNAPYGKAAVEVLRHYGVYEALKDKLVYGESIAQTNQFILTQAADLGFTAQSVLQSPRMQGQGKWEKIDPAVYEPIAQGIVILKKNAPQIPKAQQFLAFLFSEEGRKILSTFGYRIKDR